MFTLEVANKGCNFWPDCSCVLGAGYGKAESGCEEFKQKQTNGNTEQEKEERQTPVEGRAT